MSMFMSVAAKLFTVNVYVICCQYLSHLLLNFLMSAKLFNVNVYVICCQTFLYQLCVERGLQCSRVLVVNFIVFLKLNVFVLLT